MSFPPQKAIVLISPTKNENFQKNLFYVLDSLGWNVDKFQSFRPFLEQIDKCIESFQLLIFDPYVPSFKAEVVERSLSKSKNQKLSVLLLSAQEKEEILLMEEELVMDHINVSGQIPEFFSPTQMAFVIHRCGFFGSSERRRTPRALVECGVSFKQFGDPSQEFGKTFCLNVNGMFLVSKIIKPKRTFLKLRFTLHSRKTIHCLGRVVFVRENRTNSFDVLPSGMGIRFMKMSEKDRNEIFHFIFDRIPKMDQRSLEKKSMSCLG